MRITLCARSKILEILGPTRVFRIQATGNMEAGSHIDLIPDTEVTEMDSTISRIPHVVVDILTATFLAGQNIDFDYNTEEFIISNRGNE